MIRPTMLNLLVLSFIGKMKIFDLVWITTKGGPLWSTETVSTYVYKRAFEWNTFDLGYPSAIASVWFVIVLGSVLTLTLAVPPAREARVLTMAPPRLASSSSSSLRLALCVLHGVRRRPVRLGRDDVAAHDHRDLAATTTPGPDTLHWEKFPDAWFNSNYGVYFRNSLLVVVSAVIDPDADRRDGRALLRALPVPAEPPASTSSSSRRSSSRRRSRSSRCSRSWCSTASSTA